MPKQITIDLNKVEQFASLGLSLDEIANNLNISRASLRTYRQNNQDIEDAIQRGRDKGIAKVANALFQKAMSGNIPAMIFFLKAKGGWKEENSVNVKTDQPIQITFKNDLKD